MSGNFITTELGYSGKIPSRGDFLTHGLTMGFVDSWNEWLQAVLAVSREQLTDKWLATYLTSPIWHFALSADVCGDNAMLGSLMPSVDQVGRHYPFTLAKQLNAPVIQARLNNGWTEQHEDLILQTLEDNFKLTPWQEALVTQNIAWPTEQQIQLGHTNRAQAKAAIAIEVDNEVDASLLLHHNYQQHYGRYCIWWTHGSELIPPCTLLTAGLPQVSQFAAMLDGDWQRWGWQFSQIKSTGN
ncbi:type VI secretion system-associated protein TagF [Rheinheimera sp. MMS21-TC3]|uniref:type VI secretion system-associated protein TagF n=1 Tax=Rheinheimera sp. MMS21-TC3 TaxID=3072790 RepID=UPI0028C3AAD2|nr:type VI secretion system-associated protein TagF [Rheinheimera sp. MMS21-TC3]WNO60991.1 type VI secretion system-associated protein TagF [Rheinheimera sp. MMS21-TC3]